MDKVPHITIEQFNVLHTNNCVDGSLRSLNRLIDEANAEQPLITAEEARKLGAGKAEFHKPVPAYQSLNEWDVVGYTHQYSHHNKYRAIKQPEPVEPKICTIKKLDTGIYTYKQKANLVKLDGELMTREAAIALAKSKEATHYLNAVFDFGDTNVAPSFIQDSNCAEYQLRPKQPKQVSWKNVPFGVAVINSQDYDISSREKETLCLFLSFDSGRDCISLVNAATKEFKAANYKNVKLAPASDQPWIAVQDDRSIIGLSDEFQRNGFTYEFDQMRFRITGLAEGYELK